MFRRQIFLFFILLTVMIGGMMGCKKENSCPNLKANLDGAPITLDCFSLGSSLLDSNYFRLTTLRPNQVTNALYSITLRFKKQIGVQQLDTAVNEIFVGSYLVFYKNYFSNRKTYSLFSQSTNAEITITSIDEKSKMVTGTFSGILCEMDSINDRIQITNGSFYTNYQ